MSSQEEFQLRRQRLANSLLPDSLAIIPSAKETMRNGDTPYRFRQNSNFYYLTGFNEPEAVLLILPKPYEKSYLYNRPSNNEAERWTGKRLGQKKACEILGVDEAYSIDDFLAASIELLAKFENVYFPMGEPNAFKKEIFHAFHTVKQTKHAKLMNFFDLNPILAEMRLIKSEGEISLLRQAANISVKAHKKIMSLCKSAKNERELEAEFIYQVNKNGCKNLAYDSIIAAGNNACILHYTDNNNNIQQGDLILIDAGGEFSNYAADITRTLPASGHFTKEQGEIYELVLKAQKAGINCIKPGVAWHKIQEIITNILTTGLADLGLLKGSSNKLLEEEAYKLFYFHGSGHWLGLDVHDVGNYKINDKWRELQPGMVLTVEPGLYISPSLQVNKNYLGMGVRIEDDILVTDSGYEILTAALPKDLAKVEEYINLN